jgi:hypothetical protein
MQAAGVHRRRCLGLLRQRQPRGAAEGQSRRISTAARSGSASLSARKYGKRSASISTSSLTTNGRRSGRPDTRGGDGAGHGADRRPELAVPRRGRRHPRTLQRGAGKHQSSAMGLLGTPLGRPPSTAPRALQHLPLEADPRQLDRLTRSARCRSPTEAADLVARPPAGSCSISQCFQQVIAAAGLGDRDVGKR